MNKTPLTAAEEARLAKSRSMGIPIDDVPHCSECRHVSYENCRECFLRLIAAYPHLAERDPESDGEE